jgi:hypothetical protein
VKPWARSAATLGNNKQNKKNMKTNIFRKHSTSLRGAQRRSNPDTNSWMAPAFGLAMTVALLLIAAPALAQPYDLTVCGENKPFSLVSVEPAEGPGVITYTWDENDIPMDNSNTASICITEGRPAGTYAYVRKASSDACPGEVASTPYTVEVVATPAPTLLRAPGYACDGTATTFTATGGSGTYEWSCSNFTCKGTGATQTTSTTVGTYTASVRSVIPVNGAQCFSDPAILTVAVHALGAKGEAAGPCGCGPNLGQYCGFCLDSHPGLPETALCKSNREDMPVGVSNAKTKCYNKCRTLNYCYYYFELASNGVPSCWCCTTCTADNCY